MIGIISRTEGEGGGAEAVLCHLLAHWDKQLPLVVITAHNSSVAQAAIKKGLQVISLSFIPYKIWPNLKSVELVLKKLRGLKLVHAWNAKSFELGWYIAKRLDVKLTCTMHDHPASAYFTPRKLWLLKKIANNSSGLASVSKALTKACLRYRYSCFLTTIANGLPELEVDLGKKQSEPVFRIGFLGMNSTVKGFELIAEWIKKTASVPQMHWHLYGQVCEPYEHLLACLNAQGLQNFTICGRQPTEAIFREINLLVHASTSFDSYPTVLLEAARAGIPAIASNCGGAAEIVQHSHTGFVFNLSETDAGLEGCINLYKDNTLYQTFAGNARALYKKSFGIAYMVDKYYNFWISALK